MITRRLRDAVATRTSRMRGAVAGNRVMLGNSGALMGTTVSTSLLGFVYWWIAAHQFTQSAVGLASAAISAMTLVGTIASLGVGTFLMGEIPLYEEGSVGGLITTGLAAATLLGAAIGGVAILLMPALSSNLAPIGATPVAAGLFILGTALTSGAFVADQALLGMLRGSVQLWRNLLFGALKLALLPAATLVLTHASGMTIFATWAVGLALSFVALGVFVKRRTGRFTGGRLRPRFLRGMGRAITGHQLLNLGQRAPVLALPILVAAVLSTAATGSFYIAWMIASFTYVIPSALTTVLYAIGAQRSHRLPHQLRLSLGISAVSSVLAMAILFVGAGLLLGIFGGKYAHDAGTTLQILGVAGLPLAVKNHFVAIVRINRKVVRTIPWMWLAGALEFTAAAIAAKWIGHDGPALGWCSVLMLESVVMTPTIVRAIRGSGPSAATPATVRTLWPRRPGSHSPETPLTASGRSVG